MPVLDGNSVIKVYNKSIFSQDHNIKRCCITGKIIVVCMHLNADSLEMGRDTGGTETDRYRTRNGLLKTADFVTDLTYTSSILAAYLK